MADFAVYMRRKDIPTETRCHTICGESLLDSTKQFIRKRANEENRKFGKGFNPWQVIIEPLNPEEETRP